MSYIATPEAGIGFMTGFRATFRNCIAVLLVVLVVMRFATAAGIEAPRPDMKSFPLSSAPQLDGEVLAEPSWQGVTPATGFWQVQPDEGLASTQKTEVYIGVKDNALYIGMVAYDDNPAGIIVTDGRRDRNLNQSDSFRVIIDGITNIAIQKKIYILQLSKVLCIFYLVFGAQIFHVK